MIVQSFNEIFQIFGFFCKFYQPLMIRQTLIRIDLCSNGKFLNLGGVNFQSFFNRLFNFMRYHMFSKSRSEMLDSTRNNDFIWIQTGKSYSITDVVSPQSSIGVENYYIIFI